MVQKIKALIAEVDFVADAAQKYLSSHKIAYNLPYGSSEVLKVYGEKLSDFAEASDHLVAVKVALYLSGKTTRESEKQTPSEQRVAVDALLSRVKEQGFALNDLRFALIDYLNNMKQVLSGLTELKRALLERT